MACWQQHWQHTSLADPPRPRGCDRSVPRAQQQLLREGSQVEVLEELIRMEQNCIKLRLSQPGRSARSKMNAVSLKEMVSLGATPLKATLRLQGKSSMERSKSRGRA